MMAEVNSKTVRRIVVLQQDAAGGYTPVTVYRKKSKRKKGTPLLRPLEKGIRRLSDGAAAMTQSYTDRHRRSNEKKKNGWLRDMDRNASKAANKGRKAAKLRKPPMPFLP
jgi:mRNA-degrading endonuclease toxin of MazEF toxin-antitoxin module